MRRNLFFYIATLLIFGTGIYFILQAGSRLQSEPVEHVVTASNTPLAPAKTHQPIATEAGSPNLLSSFATNARHPLSILLLQVIVIVIVARSIGFLFRKMGQPAVIGEIVAGILLGPSLLGMLSPATLDFLFPTSSLDALKLLSQVGVILFMFVVGMELDVEHLRERAHDAILVSHASIIIPFFLGTALSLFIYTSLAPAHVTFSAFALFMGIAMSITAFPVLARIIEERGLSKSHLGNTAIACAAVDDVTAWCILALVVAIVQAAALVSALLTVGLVVLFMGLMLFLLKPQFERLSKRHLSEDGTVHGKGIIAGVMVFVLICALATEIMGIHALFGAFMAGVIMPSHARFRQFLEERVESFSSSFLLPLFFAFTGLRTQIGLLNDWRSWAMCLGIIAVAIAGKLGGSMIAARWTGMTWTDSFAIGALMNTRGLMELIALNIGYELGILSPRIFAMMVLMALVTTFMTGPLLALADWWKQRTSLVVSTSSSVA